MPVIAGVELDDVRPVGGGDICRAVRATADGRPVFAKTLAGAPPGFFTAEARGLDLLRVAGAPPVPEVVAAADDGLVLTWVEPGLPTADAAAAFGQALARMHATALPAFGADRPGFIGSLPLDHSAAADWPTFYVERRPAPSLGALAAG